jgi:hypothetical protein
MPGRGYSGLFGSVGPPPDPPGPGALGRPKTAAMPTSVAPSGSKSGAPAMTSAPPSARPATSALPDSNVSRQISVSHGGADFWDGEDVVERGSQDDVCAAIAVQVAGEGHGAAEAVGGAPGGREEEVIVGA